VPPVKDARVDNNTAGKGRGAAAAISLFNAETIMSGYESLDRPAIAFAPSRELTAGGFLDYAAFCASLSRHRLSACARAV